jgi:hypothetical protein
VVIPFSGDIRENSGSNVLEKLGWRSKDSDIWKWFRDNCPAILVIDKDVDAFVPKDDPYVIIALRQSMDEFGNIKVFEVKELFDLLAEHAQTEDLFQNAPPQIHTMDRAKFWKSVDLKPGMFGFAMDLKSGVQWLTQRRLKTHQYV